MVKSGTIEITAAAFSTASSRKPAAALGHFLVVHIDGSSIDLEIYPVHHNHFLQHWSSSFSIKVHVGSIWWRVVLLRRCEMADRKAGGACAPRPQSVLNWRHSGAWLFNQQATLHALLVVHYVTPEPCADRRENEKRAPDQPTAATVPRKDGFRCLMTGA